LIRGVLGGVAAVVPLLSVHGTAPGTAGVPLPSYDTSRIVEVDFNGQSFGAHRFTVTTYRNEAYRCGREGAFPFVVVEPSGATSMPRPLWILLHGGGIGYYDDEERYVTIGGTEAANDAEQTGRLLALLFNYVGADGGADTFVADRLAAGDRFVLGSLCDHDLYVGIGQPYPHNPNHDDTVDGLLANLAMVDAVTNGTASVPGRATSSLWTVGTSAGAFGAYALTHNLWARGVDVDGLVLDSGLLVERAVGTTGSEWVTDEDIVAKHGPYVADQRLWIDRAIADGFDVALFDTVEDNDVRCRGSGAEDGCTWLHGGLARAISDDGDPSVQQVHVYPGSTHMATTRPGTQVQDDLRAWYRLVAHSRDTDRTDLSH
jgi:hypothetical protein